MSPRLDRHRPRDHSHQGTRTPGEGWNHSAEGKRSGLKETASLDNAQGHLQRAPAAALEVKGTSDITHLPAPALGDLTVSRTWPGRALLLLLPRQPQRGLGWQEMVL